MAKKHVRQTATPRQIAAALSVSMMTVHRMCDRNIFEFYRLSDAPKSFRRIFVDSVLAYAKKQGRTITISTDA